MTIPTVVQIEESQRDYWDKEISQFEMAHPLNAFGWGKVRTVDGWSPTYFIAKRDSTVTGAVMVMTKPILGAGLTIMYAQRGPVWDISDDETLKALLQKTREYGQQKKAIFLRIDPHLTEAEIGKVADILEKEGFIHLEYRWTFWNSPRDVYRINLLRFECKEELFNSIDRQARKAVRKARKEGVTIQHATSLEELWTFYEVFRKFTVKKGFMARGFEYQKSLWTEYILRGNGRLFLAIYQGKIIGGLICIIFAHKCLAMHMGTPREYGQLRTNDACVWESLRWAKENNCLWYSFRGVGTTPSQQQFKKKFGPEVVSLVGYYDFPFYSSLYRLFYLGEFEILPRAWSTLMRVRRKHNDLTNRFNWKNRSEVE